MIKKMLLTAGLVAASTGVVLAQGAPANNPPPANGQMPPPPVHGPKPPKHHHGPPPPPMKGFDLKMGHGKGLKVNCGDEPIKACIDAAKPLLDRLGPKPAPSPAKAGSAAES